MLDGKKLLQIDGKRRRRRRNDEIKVKLDNFGTTRVLSFKSYELLWIILGCRLLYSEKWLEKEKEKVQRLAKKANNFKINIDEINS